MSHEDVLEDQWADDLTPVSRPSPWVAVLVVLACCAVGLAAATQSEQQPRLGLLGSGGTRCAAVRGQRGGGVRRRAGRAGGDGVRRRRWRGAMAVPAGTAGGPPRGRAGRHARPGVVPVGRRVRDRGRRRDHRPPAVAAAGHADLAGRRRAGGRVQAAGTQLRGGHRRLQPAAVERVRVGRGEPRRQFGPVGAQRVRGGEPRRGTRRSRRGPVVRGRRRRHRHFVRRAHRDGDRHPALAARAGRRWLRVLGAGDQY